MLKLSKNINMTLRIFLFIALVCPLGLMAQSDGDQKKEQAFFWVTFTDKKDNPYSIYRPEEYLSAKALSRRLRYQIRITENDLPVNPQYLDSLRSKGAKIHHTSKWMNGATILIDKQKEKMIGGLPFVDTVEYVGFPYNNRGRGRTRAFRDSLESELLEKYYGYSEAQIKSFNGDSLHLQGFTGKGITVAVLDGGFINADSIPFFDSLRIKNQFGPHRDFVDGDNTVFESSSHGTQVLSTMASNIPGLLVGSGPGATYICIKTEDTRGEYRLEECHWVAGLEYADSIGADIVNSSLGYTTFNDRKMNYDYNDLDGETAMTSRAADIAVSKGMIVVTSAGNEGNSKWKYLGTPADGKEIFSVGATNATGEKAGFSSVGPTADGRTKPDVAAMGSWVAVTSTSSFRVSIGSGTSFSSPLVTGMIACLMEAFPEKTNKEILDAVRQSGSQHDHPDNELGHGTPDFLKAYNILRSTRVKP